MTLLAIIILVLPTAWELFNDRAGDLNKAEDVFVRAGLMLGAAAGCYMLGFNFWLSLNLTVAIYFAFFDYIISYILIKNGTLEPPRGVRYHWYSYTAKAGLVDNFKFWRNMKPGWKLTIRLAYFAASLLIFLTHGNL